MNVDRMHFKQSNTMESESENILLSTFILYQRFLYFHDILNLISVSKALSNELWQYIIELYVDTEYMSSNNKFQLPYVYSIHKLSRMKILSIENSELFKVKNLLSHNTLYNTQLFMKNIYGNITNDRNAASTNSYLNILNQNPYHIEDIYQSSSKDLGINSCINYNIRTFSVDYYTGCLNQLKSFSLSQFHRLITMELKNCLKITFSFVKEIVTNIPTIENLVIENSLLLQHFDLSCCFETNMKSIAIRHCPNFICLKSSCTCSTITTISDSSQCYICCYRRLNIESLDFSHTSISTKILSFLFSNPCLRGNLRSLKFDNCLKLTGNFNIEQDLHTSSYTPTPHHYHSEDKVNQHKTLHSDSIKLCNLSLLGCFGITSIYLQLPFLATLCIEGCFSLQSLTLSCHSLKELHSSPLLLYLKYLNIERCDKLIKYLTESFDSFNDQDNQNIAIMHKSRSDLLTAFRTYKNLIVILPLHMKNLIERN